MMKFEKAWTVYNQVQESYNNQCKARLISEIKISEGQKVKEEIWDETTESDFLILTNRVRNF